MDEVIDVMRSSFTQLQKQLNGSLHMSTEEVVALFPSISEVPLARCMGSLQKALLAEITKLSKSQVADVILTVKGPVPRTERTEYFS